MSLKQAAINGFKYFLFLSMHSNDNSHKLNRNAFKMMSFEESDNYMRNYKDHTWQERLSVALYLTSIAFKFDINNPPRLDRNCFHALNRK